MSGLVTLGESLALLRAPSLGPLRSVTELKLGVAGAESNVAIAMRRLGHDASWAGCVGDDELGRLVTATLRGEELDVRARIVPGAQTALMLRERRTEDVTRVAYYRTGSAGSRLSEEDLDALPLAAADVLHVTGITAALGPVPFEALKLAMRRAHDAGVLVSFDVNYRALLWSRSAAAGPVRELASLAEIIFAGEDELALMLGDEGGEDPLTAAQQLGPRQVVLKLGAAGARALCGGEVWVARAPRVTAVDPVGAGDAFVAGYLSAAIEGLSPAERLRRACSVGAFAVATPGDWEGLPFRAELDLLDLPTGSTLR